LIRSTLAAGLFLIAAASPAAAETASPAPAAAPVPGQVPPGPGKADWADTFARARERADHEGRVVYVEFFEKTCGNCVRMQQLLYPAVNFEMMLLRMVPVRLDRLSVEGGALAERYGVTQSPSVLILSPGGALIFRVDGFDNAGEFYRHVHTSMTGWDALHLRMIHEPEFRDDPKQELALGEDLLRRMDPEEAAPRFDRAARSKTADAATRDLALTALATAQYRMKRFPEARATLDDLLRTSRDPAIREQAELSRGLVEIAEGKREEARRTIAAFLREHPESRLAGNARQMLTSISAEAPAPR
jgi:tetratricopeptide (TPR) repeat protein